MTNLVPPEPVDDRLTRIERVWANGPPCSNCDAKEDVMFLLEAYKDAQKVISRLIPLLSFPVTDCEAQLKGVTLQYAMEVLKNTELKSRLP